MRWGKTKAATGDDGKKDGDYHPVPARSAGAISSLDPVAGPGVLMPPARMRRVLLPGGEMSPALRAGRCFGALRSWASCRV